MGYNEDRAALEREQRNALHLEAIAHSLQAQVRLKAAQLHLTEAAVSAMQEDGFAMPPWWQEEVHAAVSHGTRFELPSEIESLPAVVREP
jgi:hypothetical protein